MSAAPEFTLSAIASDLRALVTDLTHDGETATVTDASGVWTLRLSIEPDDMSILDEQGEGVWCGRLEYGRDRMRPSGFDGNAERLDRYHPGSSQGDYVGLWWQPPGDVPRTSEHFAALRQTILDLLTYGYVYVGLTLTHERPDGYARSWSNGLGGIESNLTDDYRREVLTDLLGEVLGEVTS